MSKRKLPQLGRKRKTAGDIAESPGLKAAIAGAGASKRKPIEEDAPPPSTFPMTPAAKEALRLRGLDVEGGKH